MRVKILTIGAVIDLILKHIHRRETIGYITVATVALITAKIFSRKTIKIATINKTKCHSKLLHTSCACTSINSKSKNIINICMFEHVHSSFLFSMNIDPMFAD